MDLPTCPACGQSVLDDDVDDCPFCGASLTTGKPSRKPPAPKAAPPKTEPVERAPAKPSAPTKPATEEAESEADDGDPFAVDTSIIQKAIRAKPKPAKGRTYKVVCPMCETTGFVSRKAAGQEVRCANPECLVPLFTAPEIEKKPVEPEEPEEEPGLPKALVAAICIVLLAAVGGGVWFFVLRDDGTQPPPDDIGVNVKAPNGGKLEQDPSTSGKEKTVDTGKKTDASAAKDVPKQPGLAEIRRLALEQMVVASRQRERNRSKPYCRRLTAEAYAQVGDLEEARSQLDQLKKVGREIPSYQITPLVTIAWKELEAGRKGAAVGAVDEAQSAARQLPEIGRDRLDMATMLATVLVALDRADEAEPLIVQDRDSDADCRLSAALQIAWALQTYNLDSAFWEPLLPWTAPQRVAVTLSLIGHGHSDAARRWAKRASGIEEQSECLAAWATTVAESAARNKQPNPTTRLQAVAIDLPPAGKARVFAGAARGQLAAGNRAFAEETLKAARAALKSIPVPEPMILPEMKELYRFELPPAGLSRTAVLAAAEVAWVEAQMDQPQATWSSLAASMQFARGMAPAVPAIQERRDEIDRLGVSAIGSRLKSLLELESNDAARRAARDYRKRCDKILEAAQARLDLQASLLSRAVDWGVRDQIWNEIHSRSVEPTADRKDPFLKTSLPWTLADRYREAGAEDQAKQIEAAISGSEQGPDPFERLKQTTVRLITEGNLGQAASRIESSRIDRTQCLAWMLRVACRLVAAGNTESAFQFVTAVEDEISREEAFLLISAQAAANGEAGKVWVFVKNAELPPTERVSVYRGLIAGLSLAAEASRLE